MNRYSSILLTIVSICSAASTLAFQPSPHGANHHRTTIRQQPSVHRGEALNSMILLSDETVSAVNGFYESAPFVSAFLTCAIKGFSADFMAQKKQEQEQLDISRSLAFLLYGGLYQGVTLQALYSEVFPALFGAGHGHVPQQVAIDLMLGVCVSLPLVYTLKEFLCNGATDAMAGVREYQRQMQSEHIHLKYIGLWAPVQTINFAMVPAHLHVPFSCCFSLLWLYILSATSAQQEDQQPAALPPPTLPTLPNPLSQLREALSLASVKP
eukprot:CAMPEP_0119014322 /NCGR_PEP_ID=MMETSP1176-20130426/9507_1 /TAXON_ID=265551 /ORGANISM="Synedropsis recta cf, Strain CCMP1620" /LENGTH=267 /DNA_ID=CAMNT_0006967477 /DNA_START=163 /DNA_END=966 /DNA_ORIENTATION=+